MGDDRGRARGWRGVSPRWEDPRTVAGFATGVPNAELMAFARDRRVAGARTCLDIGCGAARNALPIAALGYEVIGTDLAEPMLATGRERVLKDDTGDGAHARVAFVRAPMAPLPFADRVFDLVVAHGIWNLARSGDEFRAAVAEAGRVARPDAGLFLFTFSRHTLPADAQPDPGETFVFSSWNGEPQCFLNEEEILAELGRAGFVRDSAAPLVEYNRPEPGALRMDGPPVIYEGTFRKAIT